MEELQMLRDLPAVANVSKDRITYSNAFKQVCVIRYLAGESPTKIFREAGLPPELIGYKRIERSVARWKAAVLKSVNGSSNMSNGEIITELVNLYVHAVTRKEKHSTTSQESPIPIRQILKMLRIRWTGRTCRGGVYSR